MAEAPNALRASRVTQERRSDPRVGCGGTATLLRLVDPDGKAIQARLCNLSLGGCSVESQIPLRLGTRLAVTLAVNEQALRLIGEVRALKIDGRCFLSIEFVGVSEAGMETLRQVVGGDSAGVPKDKRPGSLQG